MGFSLFGPYHIGWLIVITMTVIFVSKHFKQLNTEKQKVFQQKIAWFIVLAEIFKITYLVIRNEFTVNYLPLELCSFAIFAIFYHAHTNNPMIGEMLYNLFLPGAILALLFCNWTHRQIYEVFCLFSFIFHLALVMYCVMVLYAGIVKPNKKRIISSIIFSAVIGPIIYLLNKMWNTNFMFLNVPSPGSPLVLLENILGNPGYIFGMFCIVLVLWFILYLPWYKIFRIKQ